MRDDLTLLAIVLRLSPILLGLAAWSGVLGLAVASKMHVHRGRCVLVSLLVPVLGPVAVLLGITVARRRRERPRTAWPSAPAYDQPPAAVGLPAPAPGDASAWFADAPPVPGGPVPPSTPASSPGKVERWFDAPEPLPPLAPPVLGELGAGAPPAGAGAVRLPLALCVLAVVPASLLFFALFSSWGALKGAVDFSTPVVGASPLTAVPDVLCGLTFVATGLVMAWRARGRWAVLAAIAGLASFSAGVLAHALFSISDILVDRVRRLSGVERLPVEASVEAGDALPLLVVGGASGLLWALVCMIAVDRSRSRSPTTGVPV